MPVRGQPARNSVLGASRNTALPTAPTSTSSSTTAWTGHRHLRRDRKRVASTATGSPAYRTFVLHRSRDLELSVNDAVAEMNQTLPNTTNSHDMRIRPAPGRRFSIRPA